MSQLIKASQGYRTVKGAREYFSYQVEIDWAAVDKIILKAADNKSGRSKDGPLSVKITARHSTEEKQ